MAQGRGAAERVVVPLAFETAARISARPRDAFLLDPTQLANGLLELHRAIGADGIVCALGGGIELASADGGPLDAEALLRPGTRLAASLEACRRLRATLNDGVALLAGLAGPATLARQFGTGLATAGAALTGLAKHFCNAGLDILLVIEEDEPADAEDWAQTLRTTANVVRFHRGVACMWQRQGPFPATVAIALDAPVAAGPGVVTTAEFVPPDASIETLRQWVQVVAAA